MLHHVLLLHSEPETPFPSFLLPAHSPSSKMWLKGQYHHFLISEGLFRTRGPEMRQRARRNKLAEVFSGGNLSVPILGSPQKENQYKLEV